MKNKILLLIFGVLLLLTIGELVYYFFVLSPKESLNKQNAINTKQLIQDPNIAIKEQALTYIRNFPVDILQTSRVTNEYVGEIAKVDTTDRVLNQDNPSTAFPYSVTVTLKNNNKTINFYLNTNNEKIIKISENGTESSFTPEKLPLGQKVRIVETINMLETFDNNREVFTIYK